MAAESEPSGAAVEQVGQTDPVEGDLQVPAPAVDSARYSLVAEAAVDSARHSLAAADETEVAPLYYRSEHSVAALEVLAPRWVVGVAAGGKRQETGIGTEWTGPAATVEPDVAIAGAAREAFAMTASKKVGMYEMKLIRSPSDQHSVQNNVVLPPFGDSQLEPIDPCLDFDVQHNVHEQEPPRPIVAGFVSALGVQPSVDLQQQEPPGRLSGQRQWKVALGWRSDPQMVETVVLEDRGVVCRAQGVTRQRRKSEPQAIIACYL